MRSAGYRAVCALALTAAPSPAAADEAAALSALAAQDLRVATVAFRLLTSAGPLCPDKVPVTGLLVHELRQYAVALRPAAVRAFGFAGLPVVLSVVPGSPAARAALIVGDAIVTVDGVDVARSPVPDRRAPSEEGTEALESRLAAALPRGAVSIAVERAGIVRQMQIEPVQACDSTVQLEPGRRYKAWSDGRAVAITSALAVAAEADDELAAVIGHEIAHNILHHAAILRAQGVTRGLASRIGAKARKVRQAESEADLLGLYLAARAGYDAAAAPRFWARFGPTHGGGIFADATHPSWRERKAALAQAAAKIADQVRRGEPLETPLAPPVE
jgi:hypothetical protein